MNNKLHIHTRCQEFKLFISFVVLFFLFSPLQAQMQTGLLMGGGIGGIYGEKYVVSKNKSEIRYTQPDFTLGYRFRIRPNARKYFYDIDVFLGLKRMKHLDIRTVQGPKGIMTGSHILFRHRYYSVGLTPAWNYNFFNKWYAGTGLSPTFSMAKGRENDNRLTDYIFDMPATIKVGYDFKYVDVALVCYWGLFNVSAFSDQITSATLRSLQVQVFIPF